MDDHYYNYIAEDYYNKRRRPWKPLQKFLDRVINEDVKISGISVDLGCANGRNFEVLLKYSERIVGIDISIEFLQLIKKIKVFQEKFRIESVPLILADLRFLPLRSHSIDNIFSIATIHHIKGKKKRESSLKQMQNTLRNGGYLFLTVWRRWQKKYRNYFIKEKIMRVFSQKSQKINHEFGDKTVPWTVSSRNTTINRFYHFYTKWELIKSLRKFKIVSLKKSGGSSGKDNFFVLARNEQA
ncbi:MAG: class I SAM-dependent methyltransferase [Candidatus Lokiarchaeota archaeon]|nr:class I SAM-dependent methyltransferase [Candidatus Lokiarchaeota archaeon]